MKTRKIIFYKYNLLGNNFILLDLLLDCQEKGLNLSAFAEFSLDRDFGIGGDNLIVIRSLAIEGSASEEILFNYFEPDGSEFPLCANASLCAAMHLSHYHSITNFPFFTSINSNMIKFNLLKSMNGYFSLQLNRAFDVSAYLAPQAPLHRLNTHVYSLSINPLIAENDKRLFGLEDDAYIVNIGEPHLILYTNTGRIFPQATGHSYSSIVRPDEFTDIGHALSMHPFFPEGINVNLVNILSPHLFEHRCFERGIFRETKACGTGALSSCIVNHYLERTSFSDTVKVISLGKVLSPHLSSLEISALADSEWLISGKPSLVYEGYAYLTGSKFYA